MTAALGLVNRTRWVWVLVIAGAGVALSCSDDDVECEATEDCLEVTCPDGSKIRGCEEGVCLQGSDCPNTSGW